MMNRHLNNAGIEVEKIKAILHAIEECYLDLNVEPDDHERADMAVAMFYVLKDSTDRLFEELELLEGDSRVVDAIYAANEVRHQIAP